MSPLSLAVLDPIATRGASLGEATRNVQVAQERASAFDAALGRQTADPSAQSGDMSVQPAARVAQDAPAGPPGADAVDPRERARRALELDGQETRPAGGDMILDGLQKLRGAFDARQARVAEIMESKELDAATLLSMQMEVVNYTLLVDVTSKLTGKSTQSFDTLMKGQ
jgi:type III secretion system YscI/HrpB-like protein